MIYRCIKCGNKANWVPDSHINEVEEWTKYAKPDKDEPNLLVYAIKEEAFDGGNSGKMRVEEELKKEYNMELEEYRHLPGWFRIKREYLDKVRGSSGYIRIEYAVRPHEMKYLLLSPARAQKEVKCPFCHEITRYVEVEEYKGDFGDDWDDFDYSVPMQDYYKAEALINVEKIKSTCKTSSGKNRIELDFNQVKDYLEILCAVANDLFFLQEDYVDLYVGRENERRDLRAIEASYRERCEENGEDVDDGTDLLKSLDKEINDIRRRISSIGNLSETEKEGLIKKEGLIPPVLPSKPVEPSKPLEPNYSEYDEANLEKPTMPEMKKASLFNRKKIDEENRKAIERYELEKKQFEEATEKKKNNETLKRRYEEELEKYNKNVELYPEALSKYEKEKAEYDKEYPEYEKKVNELIDEEICRRKETDFPELNKKLEDKQIERDCAENEVKNGSFIRRILQNKHSGYKEILKREYVYNHELDELEGQIVQQYNCLNEILSAGVLYEKYDDIVAWNTMYEYFVTGRVDGLQGQNGAYNLYESELRANMIISQLDTIIEQLEQIKRNQFALYKVITDVKKSIDEINSKLSDVLSSIDKISASVDNNSKFFEAILETEKGIEYNTRKSAEYARITANTTKAIAFMKAIWG